MIINPYSFGVAYDPDAQAFITAAGITDNTQKTAINTLVVSMKGFGIWTKMKAIYPFVGGTASTHKWNLKNPLDTNAAFRLVFSGGWTHSSTGALPNGTNGYGNTFLATSAIGLNSGHISFYSRSNLAQASSIEIGALKLGPDSYSDVIINFTSVGMLGRFNATAYVSALNSDSRGFYIANRTAFNVIKFHKNSTIAINSTILSQNTSNVSIFIGAANNHNVGTTDFADYYSAKECAFASIGDGLTDAEAANFYTAVQNFNTTLTRNV
jgi:hypothetical protein